MSKKITINSLIQEHEKNLARVLKIQSLLEEEKNTGIDMNQDFYKIKNGELYYMLTASFSAQKKAPLGEKRLCYLLGYERVPSSQNRGDAVDNNGYYYEFKNSFTNEKHNLNLRQIRLWQEVDFYYCFYINEEDINNSVFFVLTKKEMEEEVRLFGSYTHGTADVNAQNNLNEYSITVPVYDDSKSITKRWKEKYLSSELKQKILGV